MAKLKKYKVRMHICPTCKGNGYLKVGTEEGESIHQCWDCDSEGEFYVHKPEVSQYDVVDNDDCTVNKLLH
jgi:uncharacterized protein YbaR (Trm112 family)